MSLQWSAKTLDGDFNSEKNSFSEIPQNKLISFSLYGFGFVAYVNLTTGRLSINGNQADMPDVIEAVSKEENFPLKLYYFQRKFADFSSSGSFHSSGLEYAVCGWQGQKSKVFWRLDGETGTIQLRVEEIIDGT